ncbi:hypothetical protein [Salinadaptatus halalkaliphilus]|uniref:hypothetical protein n=1 Tax=Salinadaptatus halalkaliphilus TaxID=2419781 RepID=UPI001144A545|nr:hypothetical protein [Salinadaptatus halalkaliphilus]
MKRVWILFGMIVVFGALGAGTLGFYSPAAAGASTPVTTTHTDCCTDLPAYPPPGSRVRRQ